MIFYWTFSKIKVFNKFWYGVDHEEPPSLVFFISLQELQCSRPSFCCENQATGYCFKGCHWKKCILSCPWHTKKSGIPGFYRGFGTVITKHQHHVMDLFKFQLLRLCKFKIDYFGNHNHWGWTKSIQELSELTYLLVHFKHAQLRRLRLTEKLLLR